MSRRAVWRSYAGQGAGTRAYVAARLANAPLGGMRGDLAGLRGRVLSLGAGVGVVDRFLTSANPHVVVTAIEFDAARVASAGSAHRIDLLQGDVMAGLPAGPFDAALAVDLMHHLPYPDHERLARSLREVLTPRAAVLVKDIATRPRFKHAFNALHDRVVSREAVRCRAPEDMARVFSAAGFRVDDVRRLSPLSPYPHYLLRLTAP